MISAAAITEYALHQNYPNPFNPETTISFDLPEISKVRLTVYNPLGQIITTLLDKTVSSGHHEISFDGKDLSAGLYFYRLDAGDFTAVRKMMLIK